MQKDFVNGFEQFNKTAMESVKKVGEINMRVFERMAEQQMAAATDWLEGSVKQVEVLTGAKDIQSVFQAQSAYAAAVSDKVASHAKKAAEILAEAKDDYSKLVEEGMKAAAETPIAKAAAKVAKAA